MPNEYSGVSAGAEYVKDTRWQTGPASLRAVTRPARLLVREVQLGNLC